MSVTSTVSKKTEKILGSGQKINKNPMEAVESCFCRKYKKFCNGF